MAEPENQEPPSPLLRTLLRDWMERTMSDISEDHYAAGWMGGLEDELWDAIQRLPETTHYGMGLLDVEVLDRRRSSRKAEGSERLARRVDRRREVHSVVGVAEITR